MNKFLVVTGELQDMNGGRDEEGADENREKKKPEHAICMTQAWSPRALVQIARFGQDDHVRWIDPSDLSLNKEIIQSRGKEVIRT